MSDSYQAVYDAVRSRIGNADIGSAVESALRNANISHYADMASRYAQDAAAEYQRPSVIFRPTLSADGDQWCVLLGEDLMTGVAGFGETPAAAMRAFDTAFYKAKTPAAARAALNPETGEAP